MKAVQYAMHKKLEAVRFEEAVERVTAALKDQGFGVLTTIDVKETFKSKIDVDFRPYVILGACNPQLAHSALTEDDNVGVLLPCNVVVSATDTGSEVSIADPQAMLSIADNAQIEPVAEDAQARLEKVLEAL